MDFFPKTEIETIIKENGFGHCRAGYCWADGLLIGNGNIGAVAYAPNSMEWIINKLDVFDGRVRVTKGMTPHDEVMRYMSENGIKDSFFLDELEMPEQNRSIFSVSPLILKLHLGDGELGWCAQAFPKVSQHIELYDGELCQTIDGHFIHSRTKCITPRGANLFAMRLSGSAVFDWYHTVEVLRPYHEDMELPIWEIGKDGEIFFTQKLPDGENIYAVGVKVIKREKDIARISYKLPEAFDYEKREASVDAARVSRYNTNIACAGDVDVFVSVASSYSCRDPLSSVKEELQYAAEKGFEYFEKTNKKWWNNYWNKSCADFGNDKNIQKYWNFSMYEIACSFEKAPMPALNGLCCGPVSNVTPGVNSPFYTHDQNAQMPSMPLLVLNHVELMDALVDTYYNLQDKIKAHTKELFGNISGEGLFLPLTMTQKGEENPSGSYRYTFCGSAYTGLVLSLIWKFTKDIELVKPKIYPLLCEFIRFYAENLLTMGDDGKYHLDLSVPPEIFTMTKDDSATLSMLKTCIIAAIEISEAIGDENPGVMKWKHILENYPDIARRKDGSWWSGPDIDENHFCFGGHLLYPFFPSEACVSPEDREATKKTLEYIRQNALERSFADTDGGFHYLHDWSWLLTSMAEVRTEQKNFFPELERGLGYFAKPNGLFSHDSIIICDCSETEANYVNAMKTPGPSADPGRGLSWYDLGRCATPNEDAKKLASPVLEGNSIFLLCAAETLLQSYDSVIRLFPGVPENFTGKFTGFLAQGGFEVSASMVEGRIKQAKIKSSVGGTLKIYCSLKGMQKDFSGVEFRTENGETIMQREMKKGEEINFEW